MRSISWIKKSFSSKYTKKIKQIKSNNDIFTLAKEWMGGFATGESNFFITVQNYKTKSGLGISVRFSIAQDIIDLSLL